MIYSKKFNMTASSLKNTTFLLSSLDYKLIKGKIDINKKLKTKHLQTIIPLNAQLVKAYKINKVNIEYILQIII